MGQILYHGPWQTAYKAIGVLCPDGKCRNARITSQPDSFWTLPASVKAKGKTVSGFLSWDTSKPEYEPGILTFHPYLKGKNGMVFPTAYTFKCSHCHQNVPAFNADGSRRWHTFFDVRRELPDYVLCNDCYVSGHAWGFTFFERIDPTFPV